MRPSLRPRLRPRPRPTARTKATARSKATASTRATARTDATARSSATSRPVTKAATRAASPTSRRVTKAALAIATTAALVVTTAIVTTAVGIATAPAANAFQEPAAPGFQGAGPDLTDIVRAQPTTDAPASATYTTTPAGTGPVPVLAYGTAGQPPTTQTAKSIQIQLPIKTEATDTKPGKQFATWQPGDELTVTLPQGITFAQAPHLATSALTDLADLATQATPTNTVAANLVADNGNAVTLNPPATSMTLSSDKSVAVIRFTNAQWNTTGTTGDLNAAPWLNLKSAQFTTTETPPATPATPATTAPTATPTKPGYLLTLSGIKLNVSTDAQPNQGGAVTAIVAGNATNGLYGKPGYSTYPAVAPAACTVGTVGGTRNVSYVGGATTIAFLPPLRMSTQQTTLNATDELQQLPPTAAAETTNTGWVQGGKYQITADVLDKGTTIGTALFDFPTHSPAIPYLDATLGTTKGLTTTPLAPVANQYGTARTTALTFTVTKTNPAATETAIATGLRIAGYVPTGQSAVAKLPESATVRISVTPDATTTPTTAVNDASTEGCLTRPGASQFSATPPPAAPVPASTTIAVAQTVNRVGGLNRYDTAARLALRLAAANPNTTITAIVIANGENAKGGFDALSANYLAGRVGGTAGAPILLTEANSLPRETAQALRAILAGASGGSGPVTLYVMGKADSVSDSVVSSMTAIARSALGGAGAGAVSVVRVSGSDRYATSVQAAKAGTVSSVSFAAGSPAYKTAILASGVVNADALAAGPLSFGMGLPVLLTGEKALPDTVLGFVKTQKIQQVFVLGGVDRISVNVLAQLRAAGVAVVKRISGANRYATSADLYAFARRPGSTSAANGGGLGWGSGTLAYVANGVTGFPDALAVGPLAGSAAAPLLTNGPAVLDPNLKTFLATLRGAVTAVVGLGQPSTLALGVIAAANSAVG